MDGLSPRASGTSLFMHRGVAASEDAPRQLAASSLAFGDYQPADVAKDSDTRLEGLTSAFPIHNDVNVDISDNQSVRPNFAVCEGHISDPCIRATFPRAIREFGKVFAFYGICQFLFSIGGRLVLRQSVASRAETSDAQCNSQKKSCAWKQHGAIFHFADTRQPIRVRAYGARFGRCNHAW